MGWEVGRRFMREGTYVYLRLIHVDIRQKQTQYCKAIILQLKINFKKLEGNGNPLQCSCLENPRDGGAWWAAVYGVGKSRTQMKRLSNSSSNQN